MGLHAGPTGRPECAALAEDQKELPADGNRREIKAGSECVGEMVECRLMFMFSSVRISPHFQKMRLARFSVPTDAFPRGTNCSIREHLNRLWLPLTARGRAIWPIYYIVHAARKTDWPPSVELRGGKISLRLIQIATHLFWSIARLMTVLRLLLRSPDLKFVLQVRSLHSQNEVEELGLEVCRMHGWLSEGNASLPLRHFPTMPILVDRIRNAVRDRVRSYRSTGRFEQQ